jgi:hypothetical protein
MSVYTLHKGDTEDDNDNNNNNNNNNNNGFVTAFYKYDYDSSSYEILVTIEKYPMKIVGSNLRWLISK